jgi:hypothetical protein
MASSLSILKGGKGSVQGDDSEKDEDESNEESG